MNIYKKHKTRMFNLEGEVWEDYTRTCDYLGKRDLSLTFKSDNCCYFGHTIGTKEAQRTFRNHLLWLKKYMQDIDERFVNLVHLDVSELQNGGYKMTLSFNIKQGGYEDEVLIFDNKYDLIGEYRLGLHKVAHELLFSILVYCTELDYQVDKFIFGLEMGSIAGNEPNISLDRYAEKGRLYEGIRVSKTGVEYLLLI